MPKVVNHEQRRAMIVEAACRVIVNEGLEAATVRRVSQEAGGSTGLTTHYFENKDEIVLAALERVYDAASHRMLLAVEGRLPHEALILVIDESLPLDSERRDEWRVWMAFWGRGTHNSDLADTQRRRYREWRAVLASLLSNAGLQVDPDELIALIDGIGVRVTLNPRSISPTRQKAMVRRLLGSGSTA